MQSMNSEYGSQYLAVCHFIITLIRNGNLFRSNSSSINDSYSTLKDSIFKQKIN